MSYYRKENYATWQEASTAVKILGIKSRDEYLLKYDRLDKRLHSNPQVYYKDFPGWKIFLGNEFYETWALSLAAAIRLRVTNWKEYNEKRYLDHKLRSKPQDIYSDFVYGNEQFIVKLEPKPELFHEFKHEKEFEECY